MKMSKIIVSGKRFENIRKKYKTFFAYITFLADEEFSSDS